MSENLKRCPFCGGNGRFSYGFGYEIYCEECGSRGDTYPSKKQAILRWNNRLSPWHTGIPTEKGRYVCLVRDKGCILDKYVILEWHDDSIEWGGWFRPEYTGDFEVLGWIFIGDCPYGQIKTPFDKLKASNEN